MTLKRLFNTLPLFLMEADKGASNGGDNPQGDPAQVSPPDPTKGGSSEPAWTRERAERERRSGVKDFFKKPEILTHLGITDAKEIETADDKKLEEIVGKLIGNLGEHKQLKDAQLTEAERTKATVDTLTNENTTLKEKLRQAEERAAKVEQDRVSDRVETALKLAAGEAKAKKPNQILTLLKVDFADDVAKLADKDGAVDEKAAQALIEKFRKDNPEHFGAAAGAGSPPNRGGKAPQPKPKEVGTTFRL